MHQLGSYMVVLTAIAMIGGIALSLFHEGPVRQLIRLTFSVLLTVTALSPLKRFSVPDFSDYISYFQRDGRSVTTEGENMARQAWLERIEMDLETYILDKAAQFDTKLTADISLDESGYPIFIELKGSASGDVRQQMESIITMDLGIEKENQRWTG